MLSSLDEKDSAWRDSLRLGMLGFPLCPCCMNDPLGVDEVDMLPCCLNDPLGVDEEDMLPVLEEVNDGDSSMKISLSDPMSTRFCILRR